MKGGVTVEYLVNLPFSQFQEETEMVSEMIKAHNRELEKINNQK